MRNLFFLILITALYSCNKSGNNIEKIALSDGWTLHYNDTIIPVDVPGSVHTDLLKHGIIDDPFFGSNENSLQWIGKREWVYEMVFVADSILLRKNNIELVFYGIDTYARIYLNDHLILMPDNMFRVWSVDVKDLLLDGENHLLIKFLPSETINDEKAKTYPVELPDNRAFSRKAPYHFGWDWGPEFVTAGIWRSVEIIGWDGLTIRDFQIHQELITDSLAMLSARIELDSDREQFADIKLEVEGIHGKSLNEKTILKEGQNIIQLKFDITEPERWWPAGLGEPYLYKMTLEATANDLFHDKTEIKTGLRDIQLVNEPDSTGESFYFKVNGIPLFIKGANYIPQDNFLNRVDDAKYKQLIRNALDANMNMLRIWGGGIYENDVFYKLCDEAGLLIWQDFMFACTMYPGDSLFLESVYQEAVDNVKRLRNHPCIALWCGNNEVDEGWHNWGWQKQLNYSIEDSSKVWNDYKKVFHDILPGVVQQYDPQRFYWSSSPKIGWGHDECLKEGDMHYWGVWWGSEPFEIYEGKVGRFMSEYGFQGFPPLSTIDSFASAEDQYLYSPDLKTHQKHPRGFELIDLYMSRDYPVPGNFNDYVYMSQLVQAEGITKAIEAHRRAKPYCMGTLYWQLNDCWPVISWSSIDHYGNWKALHYFVKKAYQDVLLSFAQKMDTLNVFLVSDFQYPLNGQLVLELLDFSGKKLWHDSIIISIPENSSQIVYLLADIKPKVPDIKGNCLFASFINEAGEPVASSVFYFTNPKELKLPEEELIIQHSKIKGGYRLEVKSEYLMKNVYLEMRDIPGFFSDNYFDLIPGITRKIDFITSEIVDGFDDRIEVITLNRFLKDNATDTRMEN